VNFVRDDQLLERDFLGAEFFDQIGGLLDGTLRSSSPWTSSTRERQVATLATAPS